MSFPSFRGDARNRLPPAVEEVVDVPIQPDVGALTLVGVAVALALGIGVADGALVLSGPEPTVVVGQTVAPSAAELALTGQTPSRLVDHITTPDAGALALSGQAPSRLANHITATSAGELTLSGQAPTTSITVAARGIPFARNKTFVARRWVGRNFF